MSKSALFDGGLSIAGFSLRFIRNFVAFQGVLAMIMAGWLIIACKPIPELTNTPAQMSTKNVSSTSTPTPTRKPSATASLTTTPTKTPTTTLTPSITPIPTEDLSFYNVSDCLPRNTTYQKGTVTDIVDGDTVEVQLVDGPAITVRYIGMDAPESGYPFYEEARQANFALVFDRQVVLVMDQTETDAYGRWLRYVIVGRVFVNQELVREGFVKAVNYPPDEACKDTFAATEQEAQQAFAGMWVPTQTPESSADQVIISAVNKREEWVDLQNVGNSDVDLAGWKLVSERGNQECPLSGIIKAGESLRVWAMTPQGPGYSCGYNSPIWNNSEVDPAVLYNAQGVEVSRK